MALVTQNVGQMLGVYARRLARRQIACQLVDVRVWGGDFHSDKEKFCSDLNRPESCEMSERLLKTLRKSGDFQAEYEGSIPFTRSKQFQRLSRNSRSRSDNR
jgi:hypothetical protein